MSGVRSDSQRVNSLDEAVLHVDVSAEGLVIVHDLRPLDQQALALRGETHQDQAPNTHTHTHTHTHLLLKGKEVVEGSHVKNK